MRLISLASFIDGFTGGEIMDVFSIVVGTEKRVYGRSIINVTKIFEIVYAVVP